MRHGQARHRERSRERRRPRHHLHRHVFLCGRRNELAPRIAERWHAGVSHEYDVMLAERCEDHGQSLGAIVIVVSYQSRPQSIGGKQLPGNARVLRRYQWRIPQDAKGAFADVLKVADGGSHNI
jgi:hypothetical protein